MRMPKNGDEVFFVVPPRVCIADWDSSPSLIEAFEMGFVFRNKVKAKKFCKAIQTLYLEEAKRAK